MPLPFRRLRDRPSLWIFTSLLVLAGVIGAIYAVASTGLRAAMIARNVMELDATWNRAHRDAVLHLHQYALSGDSSSWEDYEESASYVRMVRPALVAAVEAPGDSARMRAALDSGSIGGAAADFWAGQAARYGAIPEVVEVSRLRLRKDELMRALEDQAELLRVAVTEDGPASASAREQIRTIRELDAGIEEITVPFWDEMMAWAADQERMIGRSLMATAALLFLVGGGVVGFAGWRSRQAENALVESESRFRQVTENIRQVFWLLDPDRKRLLYVSPAFEEIWGRQRGDLYDDPEAWIETVHPSDRDRVTRLWRNRADAEFNEEYRIVTPAGDVRWVHDRAFPVRDESGEIHRIAGIAEDVTQRKDLEREVVQSQKLKAVGRLAGGLGHKFNNLLMVIQGHVQLLLNDHPDREAMSEDLEEVQDATRRAARLTRSLLSFAGRQMLVPRSVELSEFVRESVDMVRSLLPADVVLDISLAERVLVETDPAYLRDILLTLASRAVEDMPDGGTLFLRADWRDASAPLAVEGGRLAAGRWGRLTVEDTGRGMSPEVRERLFEPFGVTVEGAPELGMASVYGVVEQSGGGIRVESRPEGGTRFVVYLPEGRRVEDLASGSVPEEDDERRSGVEAGA